MVVAYHCMTGCRSLSGLAISALPQFAAQRLLDVVAEEVAPARIIAPETATGALGATEYD